LVWALLYHGTRFSAEMTPLVRLLLRDGLLRVLAEERPDVVLSVLPVVNGVLAELVRPAHLEVVLTDWHSVHRFWVAAGVNHYTTPSESARQDCLRNGAAPGTVDVVGVPVRPEFAGGPAADLTALGLAPGRFTILVMVGAEGSPRALRNLRYLVQQPLGNAQVLVVCGHNESLRARVERLSHRVPVRALGFVDNVAELMRAADVLVTKAGGLTLAEAFCCGVPVIVHDLLPGQEAGNLAFTLQHQAVLYARKPASLMATISRLQAQPDQGTALVRRGATLARPDAAERIAQAVIGRSEAKRAAL
jgi:processive 1,2-diacylglycerol beta-glucosyltransferase